MEPMEKKCINCGTPLVPNEKFCPNCGTPATAQPAQEPAATPEPVTAPQTAAAPEPVAAPQTAAAPEPMTAPQPAATPEPVTAPQPEPAPFIPQPVTPAPQPAQPIPEVQPTQPMEPAQPAPEVTPVQQPNVPPVQPNVPPVQPNVPPTQPNVPPTAQAGQPGYQPYPGQTPPYGQPPYTNPGYPGTAPQGYPNAGYPGGPQSYPNGYPGTGYIPTPMGGNQTPPNQGATQPQFVPQQPKKKHTGLIVGLSVGGGIVLLAAIAAVLWFVVLGGKLPGSFTTNVGGNFSVTPGQAASTGSYSVTCDEYIDLYEEVLSSFVGQTITVERYDSDTSDFALDYVICQNGEETDIRLCFYEDAVQVMGSEYFDTVMIDSWEVEPGMSNFSTNAAAAAMLLADSDCNGADAARQQIRQWVEQNSGTDTVQTLNGITYAFSYLSDGEFSSLYVADSDGASYLGGSTESTGYSSPLGEYLPETVYLADGSSQSCREYLESMVQASGQDVNSPEAQTAIDQGMNTGYYFHSDGSVELTVAGSVTEEGSYEMSGHEMEVSIGGQTIRMDYDGSTDEVTVYNNAEGIYTVFTYNGM